MVTLHASHSSHSPSCAYADINECTSQAACPSGLCLNTEGSYSCMACDAGYTVSRDGSTCEGIPFPGTEEWVLEERHIAIAGLLVAPGDFFSLRILLQLFTSLISRKQGGRDASRGCLEEQKGDLPHTGKEWAEGPTDENPGLMMPWGMLTQARAWEAWKHEQRVACGSVQNCVPGSTCPKCRSSTEGETLRPQPVDRLWAPRFRHFFPAPDVTWTCLKDKA